MMARSFSSLASFWVSKPMIGVYGRPVRAKRIAPAVKPPGRSASALKFDVVADVVLRIGPLWREIERVLRRLAAEEMLVRVIVQVAGQRVVRLDLEMVVQPMGE